ncbi:MAG TPA: hypothetical protein VN428_17300 [Bryobacteraceae bacterium]|nr:hypothetical protein [Bryobacteraceae bacterium]
MALKVDAARTAARGGVVRPLGPRDGDQPGSESPVVESGIRANPQMPGIIP